MRCTLEVQAFIETRNQLILAVSRASGKGIGNGITQFGQAGKRAIHALAGGI
jgi:hypothetical protein